MTTKRTYIQYMYRIFQNRTDSSSSGNRSSFIKKIYQSIPNLWRKVDTHRVNSSPAEKKALARTKRSESDDRISQGLAWGLSWLVCVAFGGGVFVTGKLFVLVGTKKATEIYKYNSCSSNSIQLFIDTQPTANHQYLDLYRRFYDFYPGDALISDWAGSMWHFTKWRCRGPN